MILVLSLGSCSSSPKNQHSISTLHPDTIRVRRPLGPSADPYAGPGGIDYRSEPLPNERFDCEALGQVFSEMPLQKVKACLTETTQAYVAKYRLRRVARPFLELLDPEKAPPCVKKEMASIPVPREIIFQSADGDTLQCYSAALDLEADEVLGFKLPIKKEGIEISFPYLEPISSDEELIRVLGAWALTPFWEGGKIFPAKLVPDSICMRCLGLRTRKELRPDGDGSTNSWP